MRIVALFLIAVSAFGANRYWVGGGSSANWNATGPTNWGTASNTQDDASVPGSADDVFFDGVGTGASNSTLSANITINSLDMTGYVNTLTHNAGVTLTHDSSGVFKLASGMTYTLGSALTSALSFTSTSGTTQITTAGKAVGNLTFNGSGGTFQLQDNITSTGTTITLTAGTFDPNGKNFSLTGAGTVSTSGTFTFYDLTRTGTGVKTDGFSIASNITVTNTLTLNGNSSVNRLLVSGFFIGVTRTITAATVSVSNADFRDITGAGAGSWNLSAITGLSGDCGGNSGITFTTGATQYWVGGTGNWSTAAEWGTSSGGSGGRVPLPQDDVRFDANSFSAGSQTATLDMPRAGKSIDWTGVTNTPAWAKTTASTLYGGLTLPSTGMTQSGATNIIFEGRGSFSFDPGGASFTFTNPIVVAMVGGTLTLGSSLTSSSSITHSNGVLAGSTFSVVCTTFTSNSAVTRTLSLGSGTWTVNSTGAVWTITTGSLTFSANTSTIVVSNTSATAKTFAGGGATVYNNITFSGDNITVTGSNTLATLAVNNAGLTNGLILTAGTTQTVTGFTTNGSAGNLAKILSSSAGSAATLSKASGSVSVDYMSIKDSTATGGATWCAGANSTNVSGNTGWTFSACGGAAYRVRHSQTMQ